MVGPWKLLVLLLALGGAGCVRLFAPSGGGSTDARPAIDVRDARRIEAQVAPRDAPPDRRDAPPPDRRDLPLRDGRREAVIADLRSDQRKVDHTLEVAAPIPCGPLTCTTCCAGGVCVAAPSAAQCGTKGSTCASCVGVAVPCAQAACTNGKCTLAAITDGDPCPSGKCLSGACCTGCVAGSTCQPGTSNPACGKSGSPCAACMVNHVCCPTGVCVLSGQPCPT